MPIPILEKCLPLLLGEKFNGLTATGLKWLPGKKKVKVLTMFSWDSASCLELIRRFLIKSPIILRTSIFQVLTEPMMVILGVGFNYTVSYFIPIYKESNTRCSS
jgi:hypothetical protein